MPKERADDGLRFNERQFRGALGLAGFRTVAALARRVKVSPEETVSAGYIGLIARGLVPSPALRRRIAMALGTEEAKIWEPVK